MNCILFTNIYHIGIELYLTAGFKLLRLIGKRFQPNFFNNRLKKKFFLTKSILLFDYKNKMKVI